MPRMSFLCIWSMDTNRSRLRAASPVKRAALRADCNGRSAKYLNVARWRACSGVCTGERKGGRQAQAGHVRAHASSSSGGGSSNREGSRDTSTQEQHKQASRCSASCGYDRVIYQGLEEWLQHAWQSMVRAPAHQ